MNSISIPGGKGRIEWKERKSGKAVAYDPELVAAVESAIDAVLGRRGLTPQAKPAPKRELSVDDLMAVARALAAEAGDTKDPAMRSRLYDRAGRAEIAANEARATEIRAAARRGVDPQQMERWLAVARETYPAS